MLATSYETFLLNQKLMKQNIISVPKDSQNVNALEEKTIDAWYTSVIGALSFLKEQKLNIDYYTFGNKIDTEENYIATTKKTSEKLISKVKQAIESFKKTPQYSAIVRKYTGKNP